MTTQTAEPHTYAASDLGKGHIHPLEPSRANRRVYVSYQPYVVRPDGSTEVLDEEVNLGAAVWRLKLALGLDGGAA